MTSKMIRSKTVLMAVLALAAVLVLAFGLPQVVAQERATAPAADPADAATDAVEAKVAALAKLSKEARRAELRKMSPEERRGVWFELQRAKATANGQPQPALDSLTKYRNITPNGGGQPAASVTPPERLVGMIQYDDNVGTVSFGGGAIIGNRFSTAVGNPVLSSGTISTVTAVVVQGPAFTTGSAGFVIEGPQTVGGGAMAIFSTFTNGLTATTETVSFNGLGVNYTGNSFFVLFGDFASVHVPVFGTGTTQSQGHHGVVGYTGGMGPNITSTFDFGDALNGLVRVRGNVLPVELMSFDVESE